LLPETISLRDELITQIRAVYEATATAHRYASPERLGYLTAKAGGETEQLMFKIMKRAQGQRGRQFGEPRTWSALRSERSRCSFLCQQPRLAAAVFRPIKSLLSGAPIDHSAATARVLSMRRRHHWRGWHLAECEVIPPQPRLCGA